MKLKKTKFAPKAQEPRSAAEIEKEYQLTCAALGGVTYQIEALDQKSKNFLNRINELVSENARRLELDKAEAEKTENGQQA